MQSPEPGQTWFRETFGEPTRAQELGWPPIQAGENTLILAPTGSGKTLAAFLHAIDRLVAEPTPEDDPHVRVLYISPLRALAVDVDKNLRAPLAGIAAASRPRGEPTRLPTVGVRTGDTSAAERRQIARRPPDILITTPESLYLMMTSAARDTLTRVQAIIVDEIHSVAGTKRGAHLSVTLERLADRADHEPQRIGLSATMAPPQIGARFLGGHNGDSWRPVTIVDAGTTRRLQAEIIVPIENMATAGRNDPDPRRVRGPGGAQASIWPSIHPRLVDLIEQHTSTLIFVNSRRLAERLAERLNEIATDRAGARASDPLTIRAHHGSISRQVRTELETALKAGTLAALVATSSLELGIDMGAVDLVIQVESPGSVSRGLQRIGRAGHSVGDTSQGKIFPKHRADLLEATVVAERMRAGQVEATTIVSNPLDVLAQQIVAMVALDDWPLDRLAEVVGRSANFVELGQAPLRATVDMLAGRYPSDRFSELRPRIVWDRVDDVISGRRGSQRLAVTNAGTIPERGLFGVFLADGTRVGELDEEMVHESRAGDTFILGASTWRIEQITFDRVVVQPAPGASGRMPFWRGDRPGRPAELGQAMGAFVRRLRQQSDPHAWLVAQGDLDDLAARNLAAYIQDQAAATGAVPDDRTVVIERFTDELDDWRVCIHTPFGARVHAPWATALRSRLAATVGVGVEIQHSDDGVTIRLPAHVGDLRAEAFTFEPDEVAARVIDDLATTAMFGARFREAAGRALLLPRRRPGQRTPLWQQRQRAADLLDAAGDHPDFPIVIEAVRECMSDIFDIAGLERLFAQIATGDIQVVMAETARASPFAQSMLFGWVAEFVYEGDGPRAERRAAALRIDHELLAELLGRDELRSLLDPEVIADTRTELAQARPGSVRDADDLHDVMRLLGPLTRERLATATGLSADRLDPWLAALFQARRAIQISMTGRTRVAPAEDAARLRDGLGLTVPDDLAESLLEPVDPAEALDELTARFARTNGPFTVADVAAELGAEPAAIESALERLAHADRVVAGEFLASGAGTEWCDRSVLARIRARSLAALRAEIRPVDGRAYARFLTQWQGVGRDHQGIAGLVEAISPIQGAPIPASTLEADVLAVRMAAYRPADLDALCASGDLVWIGGGAIGGSDGWIRLLFRDQVNLLAPVPDDRPEGGAVEAIRAHLVERGASFWAELVQACADAGADYDEGSVLQAIWDLVWAGAITNDTFAPLRAYLAGRSRRAPAKRRAPALGALRAGGPPAAAGRWTLVTPTESTTAGTRVRVAQANQLLHRYGVVTRAAASAESVPGGFSAVYEVLDGLEARGRVRRGYFVAGLGAAQFALPGAVDRLRTPPPAAPSAGRGPATGAVLVASTDPAQPYGSLLGWPESTGRPTRRVGTHVLLADGEPLAYLNRSADEVLTFGERDWTGALADTARRGRIRPNIAKIDGRPPHESPWVDALAAAGFTRGYRGWTLAATANTS